MSRRRKTNTRRPVRSTLPGFGVCQHCDGATLVGRPDHFTEVLRTFRDVQGATAVVGAIEAGVFRFRAEFGPDVVLGCCVACVCIHVVSARLGEPAEVPQGVA